MSSFDPVKEDRFTFGLWTVGNPGRDPFGDPVRPRLDPNEIVRGLAACGAHGVNLHDNDLVPFGADAAERGKPAVDLLTYLDKAAGLSDCAEVAAALEALKDAMYGEAGVAGIPAVWAELQP